MLNKQEVYNTVQDALNSKIEALQQQFDELHQSLTKETKSTAGDKHETGRAMAQLEQEKLSKQLAQTGLLKEALSKVNPEAQHSTIAYGSLVKTNRGYFFFSIGLGQIHIGDAHVFCMTATSPLGKLLIGKKEGESVHLNGEIQIESVL